MRRFFGGEPLGVILRLIILSIIVGVIFAALNIDPFDIVNWVQSFVTRIYNMGFDAIEFAWEYFLLGAVIVFPIWLISRLFARFGSRRAD
ncbi:MAG: DUF6460 domain-containing protein [Pseudomonadota bacterium]